MDADAPRLLLRALRNAELEHAVDVRRLDLLGIRALGKREAAQERAAGTLDAREALLGRLLLGAALALDGQHTLIGGDFDVLAVNARQVGHDDEALGFLVDVDVRDPADAGAIEVLAQSAVELPLKAAHERPRLITY